MRLRTICESQPFKKLNENTAFILMKQRKTEKQSSWGNCSRKLRCRRWANSIFRFKQQSIQLEYSKVYMLKLRELNDSTWHTMIALKQSEAKRFEIEIQSHRRYGRRVQKSGSQGRKRRSTGRQHDSPQRIKCGLEKRLRE